MARGDAGDFGDGIERDAEALALLPQVIGECLHALGSGEVRRELPGVDP